MKSSAAKILDKVRRLGGNMIKRVKMLLAAVGVIAMTMTGCGNNVSQRGIDEASVGEVEASAQTYSVTAQVNTAYSAQKLGELAALGEGYKFEFEGSDNDLKFSNLGKSSVVLRAAQDSQKAQTITLSVNVVDTISPVFNGIKDITVKAGNKPNLKKGVSVSDNYDEKVEFTVTFDKDDPDTGAVGQHVITYVAMDSSGNVASRKATLTIEGKAGHKTMTAAQTTQSITVTTTASTELTTKPADPNGKSANGKFYQDRLVVAGDSIAYGFCAYGYVPYEHNIAKGSTAMRNYNDTSLFMFDPTGTPLSMMDAIKAIKPSLLYISMGMNDVNLIDEATYVQNYKGFIQAVKQAVPDCVMIAASITPISASSKFTDINNIRACNNGLKKLVAEMNDPNVLFFDAYGVIAGDDKIYAAPDATGPDGIHLSGAGQYQLLLDKLSVLLDQYGLKDKLTQIERGR